MSAHNRRPLKDTIDAVIFRRYTPVHFSVMLGLLTSLPSTEISVAGFGEPFRRARLRNSRDSEGPSVTAVFLTVKQTFFGPGANHIIIELYSGLSRTSDPRHPRPSDTI